MVRMVGGEAAEFAELRSRITQVEAAMEALTGQVQRLAERWEEMAVKLRDDEDTAGG